MQSSDADVLFDFSQVLPGHGENRVELSLSEGRLILGVFYDGPTKEECIEFVFERVAGHVATVVPGVDFTQLSQDAPIVDQLVAFGKSEAASQWNAHFKSTQAPVRHFCCFFATQGLRVEVFARSYERRP